MGIIKSNLLLMETSSEIIAASPDVSAKDGGEQHWIWRVYAAGILLVLVGWVLVQPAPRPATPAYINAGLIGVNASSTDYALYNKVLAEVLPTAGIQTKIVLGDSIVQLVANGVIDKDKFEALYKDQGGLPAELKDVLTTPSNKPILLTKDNANFYVNLLWPLGLSNYMAANEQSPINGKDLNGFASTGGWNIGKEENGGAYFNKFKIVPLTPEQEARVMVIANNTYRPCCDNSTFFQDCNHGSAALALVELGVAQGLSDADIYQTLLDFNSFWFPQNYVQLGLYFKSIKHIDWKYVDPRLVLSKDYSSATGNYKIQDEVAKIPNLVPSQSVYGGASCGT